MLYNVIINQKSIVENGFDIKANHIAVLEAISTFILSNSGKTLNDENGYWYWVSYELIINQLPMFEIKKDRCRQLVKDLCNIGLLEANPQNQKLGRVYLRIGEKYTLYKNFDPLLKNSQPPLENFSNPLVKKFTTPLENFSNDNNTNNNSINENYTNKNNSIDSDFNLDDDFEKEKNCAKKEKEFIPKNQIEKNALEVLNYLNDNRRKWLNSKRDFEPTSKTHFSFITTRLQKYSVDELKGVIAIKFMQWANNPNMKQYLTPDTLFNETKCAKYIQELDLAKQNPNYANEQRSNQAARQQPNDPNTIQSIFNEIDNSFNGAK